MRRSEMNSGSMRSRLSRLKSVHPLLRRPAPRPDRARREGALLRRDLGPLALFMIPAAVAVLVIDLAPAVIGVLNSFRLLSFSTLEHWFAAPWVGVRNYQQAITGSGGLTASGLTAVWNSLSYAVLVTILALVVGVVAALTVARRTSAATPLVRTIYLIPTALPLFTSSYLWYMILQPRTGLLDVVRSHLELGTNPNRFLIGQDGFAVLVLVDLWLAWGFIYLFALAALQSIPSELYEAAEIDGASRLQKFRYVTYPGIRRLMAIAAVLSTFGHYNNFTLPYILFGQSPPPDVALLPTTTYAAAYSIYNFGLADALAVVGVIVIVIPVALYVRYIFSTRGA